VILARGSLCRDVEKGILIKPIFQENPRSINLVSIYETEGVSLVLILINNVHKLIYFKQIYEPHTTAPFD